MNKNLEARVIEEANKIIESKKTLRQLAKEMKIGKSTIHKDMQKRLVILDENLYNKVQKVFQEHLEKRYYLNRKKIKK